MIITTGDAAGRSPEVAHKLQQRLVYFSWKWTDRASSHKDGGSLPERKEFHAGGVTDFEPETQRLHSVWSKAVLQPCWDQSSMQQLHTSQAGLFAALNTADVSSTFPTES